jgi:hypothetical protein
MSTTDDPEPTGQPARPNLKNVLARAFLAGGLGLAVMGLSNTPGRLTSGPKELETTP